MNIEAKISVLLLISLSGCLIKGPAIVNEHLPSVNPHRQVLDVANFSDADWEYFGFYDGGGSFEHQYGGKGAGYYEYHFRGLDQDPKEFLVRARLSAESNTKGLPEEKSEVTLSVNGVEIGTQLVIPDDSHGQVYEWRLKDRQKIRSLQLQPNEQNTLRFAVKGQAQHRNGIVLYGAALLFFDLYFTIII
jgi:hypothetical protein